jgi:hypothetical protein
MSEPSAAKTTFVPSGAQAPAPVDAPPEQPASVRGEIEQARIIAQQ